MQWHLLMAATAIAVVPALIFYVILQRRLTEGIAITGLGGR